MNEIVNKLHLICQETTCTLFKLSIEANSSNWTLYIFKSKIMFKGSFEYVIQSAIDEFLTYRLDPLPLAHKNYVGKYRYLKLPSGNNYKLKNPSPNYKPSLKVSKPKNRDSYLLKLEFSKQLGFKNFTECFSSLGMNEFNDKFKLFQNKKNAN